MFPEVYSQPIPYKPPVKVGQLTEEQLKQFYNEGFVILEDFIDKNLLDEAKDAIEELVDDLADQLLKAGKISKLYKEEGLFTRMTKINEEFPGASVLLHKAGVLPPQLQKVWSYPALLNIIEQLLGPEIVGHAVWNLRVKLPHNEPEVVPWHQDNGYLEESALSTMMPTAWIPLLNTGKDNGGMEVIKFTQKKGVTGPHHCCAGATWYIEMEEEDIVDTFHPDMDQDLVTCSVPYGGVLLFSNALVHRSLPNMSASIRWSLDFRWQDPRKPTGRPDDSGNLPLMMSKGKVMEEVDWSGVRARHRKDVKKVAGGEDGEDEFDTRIAGPWMKRWPVKHHNKHTKLAMKTLGEGGHIIGWH